MSPGSNILYRIVKLTSHITEEAQYVLESLLYVKSWYDRVYMTSTCVDDQKLPLCQIAIGMSPFRD